MWTSMNRRVIAARGVNKLVDRRFDRTRFDAQFVLDDLSASMRDQVDPERSGRSE